MKRRLLNLLRALSLLACLVPAMLLVRSYFREDRLRWGSTQDAPGRLVYRQWVFTSIRGRLHWERQTLVVTDAGNIAKARIGLSGARPVEHESQPGGYHDWPGSWSSHSLRDSFAFDGGGPVYDHLPPNDGSQFYFAAGPLWLPALAGAAVPAWWLWRRRRAERRQRSANGLCVRCGYDLRETPQRCPECGAVPSDPT